MKAFIVVSCLVLVTIAKPQGYTYEKPNNDGLSVSLLLPPSQNQQIPTSFPALSTAHTTQYSNSHSYSSALAPISSHGSLGLGSHSSGGSLSLGSSYSVGHGPTINTFGSSSFDGSSFGGNSLGGSSFGGNSLGSSLGGGSFGGSTGSGIASFNGNSFSNGGSFASAGLQAPSFIPSPVGPSAANTVVQKHIYVHVPPPEEEELAQPIIAPVSQAQKHYKIIFIKAPSGPSISQQLAQVQLQQPSEEKTLVYVLVKKQESIEELANSIPRAPLSQPSKPEVYFIKYKAQTGGSGGGFSAPIPVSQPIGLSAPSAGAQTIDFSSADLSSSSAAAAAVASSSQSAGGSLDASSSLSGSDAASIAAAIQPRTPAPEYGPPKH